MWTNGVKSHYLGLVKQCRMRLDEVGRNINRPNPETLDVLIGLFRAASLTMDTLESLSRSHLAYTARAAANTATGHAARDGTAPAVADTSSKSS